MVATLKASGQPCCECGQPIDLTLKWPHPYSFSVDYRIPWSKGGPMNLHNCKPCHLKHNQSKGTAPAHNVTSRAW